MFIADGHKNNVLRSVRCEMFIAPELELNSSLRRSEMLILGPRTFGSDGARNRIFTVVVYKHLARYGAKSVSVPSSTRGTQVCFLNEVTVG
jgi:hypothetical protein